MNPELEALIRACEAATEARGGGAKEDIEDFERLLDEAITHHAGISRDTLKTIVLKAHRDWLRAQKKPSSIPPKG
jgi:hypothetical protein